MTKAASFSVRQAIGGVSNFSILDGSKEVKKLPSSCTHHGHRRPWDSRLQTSAASASRPGAGFRPPEVPVTPESAGTRPAPATSGASPPYTTAR